MSEHLTPEDNARIKAREARFATFALGLDVQNELNNSVAVKALMDAVFKDAMQAMEDIAETSPLDSEKIALHLVNIKTYVYIRRVMTRVLREGDLAETQIVAEDRAYADHGGE